MPRGIADLDGNHAFVLEEHSALWADSEVQIPLIESAWDAGRAAGEAAALNPTRIDLAGDKNPYRRARS